MTNFSYTLTDAESAALDYVVSLRNAELAADKLPQDVTAQGYLSARVKDVLASYRREQVEALAQAEAAKIREANK